MGTAYNIITLYFHNGWSPLYHCIEEKEEKLVTPKPHSHPFKWSSHPMIIPPTNIDHVISLGLED